MNRVEHSKTVTVGWGISQKILCPVDRAPGYLGLSLLRFWVEFSWASAPKGGAA